MGEGEGEGGGLGILSTRLLFLFLLNSFAVACGVPTAIYCSSLLFDLFSFTGLFWAPLLWFPLFRNTKRTRQMGLGATTHHALTHSLTLILPKSTTSQTNGNQTASSQRANTHRSAPPREQTQYCTNLLHSGYSKAARPQAQPPHKFYSNLKEGMQFTHGRKIKGGGEWHVMMKCPGAGGLDVEEKQAVPTRRQRAEMESRARWRAIGLKLRVQNLDTAYRTLAHYRACRVRLQRGGEEGFYLQSAHLLLHQVGDVRCGFGGRSPLCWLGWLD